VLIGARTGKLLYVGNRNKYCCICASADKKRVETPKYETPAHECYRNYDGASTGMEQEMIVEGFCKSERLYGLRYLFYVGDGDSSVFARIRERCAYGSRVQKVPCKNHSIRAVTSGLYAITLNRALKHPNLRKILRNTIPRIIKGINIAIFWSTETQDKGTLPNKDRVKLLQKKLKNVLYHAFGDHSNCEETCPKKGKNAEINLVPQLQATDIWGDMESKVVYLVSNAENLRSDVNTNLAECFMSVNSRIQGSKRINRSNRGGYATRTNVAALKFRKGAHWSYYSWKKLFYKSPNKIAKKLMQSRDNRREKSEAARNLRLLTDPASASYEAKRKQHKFTTADHEYGPDAAKPDLQDDLLSIEKEKILKKLALQVDTEEKRLQLTIDTVGQFDNDEYKKAKEKRLTASKFGPIYKMQDETHPHPKVYDYIHPRVLSNEAITYGIENEPRIIRQFSDQTGLEVRPSGLCVNEKWPYLGASPDGLIDSDALIEVKCLFSAKDFLIMDYIRELRELIKSETDAKEKKRLQGKLYSLCLIEKGGQLTMKKKHDYYYQVQGQLGITGRSKCFFVVGTDIDMQIFEIHRDNDVWEKMAAKLSRYYNDCLLPEFVDSRIARGMKVRDPPHYIEALKKKLELEEEKKRKVEDKKRKAEEKKEAAKRPKPSAPKKPKNKKK
jgi:hypothetical protein